MLFWVPKGPGVIVVRQWLTENGMAARVVGCAHAFGFGSRGVSYHSIFPYKYFVPDVQMVARERENVSHSLTLHVL